MKKYWKKSQNFDEKNVEKNLKISMKKMLENKLGNPGFVTIFFREISNYIWKKIRKFEIKFGISRKKNRRFFENPGPYLLTSRFFL